MIWLLHCYLYYLFHNSIICTIWMKMISVLNAQPMNLQFKEIQKKWSIWMTRRSRFFFSPKIKYEQTLDFVKFVWIAKFNRTSTDDDNMILLWRFIGDSFPKILITSIQFTTKDEYCFHSHFFFVFVRRFLSAFCHWTMGKCVLLIGWLFLYCNEP